MRAVHVLPARPVEDAGPAEVPLPHGLGLLDAFARDPHPLQVAPQVVVQPEQDDSYNFV